jgi:hypothetical protein
MKIPKEQVPMVLAQALRGMARLQARQEMMECVIRALIVETPPAHPLFWNALQTAKSDLDARAAAARPANENRPEIAADAMALWNVLLAACAPPTGGLPPTNTDPAIQP